MEAAIARLHKSVDDHKSRQQEAEKKEVVRTFAFPNAGERMEETRVSLGMLPRPRLRRLGGEERYQLYFYTFII